MMHLSFVQKSTLFISAGLTQELLLVFQIHGYVAR